VNSAKAFKSPEASVSQAARDIWHPLRVEYSRQATCRPVHSNKAKGFLEINQKNPDIPRAWTPLVLVGATSASDRP